MISLNYSSDAPVHNRELDQFNRFPFAQRVASIISKRNDPNSIVIGIYGAWGEGKTSVFNFIESELEVEEVICLRFNPWRFGDEDQMLINFFNDLAKAIDKSIESGKEKIGDFLINYVKPAASLIGHGESADGVAAFFSGADVEELKERIEKLLKEEKKRVVILVDDIDRLEKDEIHALFRLIKLTADFKYTAYILAFDKHVVSSALQERYAGETTGSGYSFLEKIIQIPLQLPSIDKDDLRSLCFNAINEVLEFSEIDIKEENAREFVNNFSKGLEPHLKTPRQAKLYSNILMFSLPILKEEVNIVDLMLIEGIRVFLPTVYTLIRDNQDLFLNDGNRGLGYDAAQNERLKRKERIDESLGEFNFEELEQIKDLLCYLFPKLNNIFKNTHYGNDWETRWTEKQRICSPRYFQRYFTYAISNKDVSDLAINELLRYSELHSIDEIVNEINTIITDMNAEVFISKLRAASKKFTSRQSEVLALSVARLGGLFPNPMQMFRTMNPYGQAALFTGDCIENIKDRDTQIELAEKVILYAEPLSFSAECYWGFRRNTEEHPNPQGFSNEEYSIIGRVLAKRISSEFSNIEKLEISEVERFSYLLFIWNEFGEPNEATNLISEKIRRDQNFVFELLNTYTPTAFGTFGAKKSSFSKDNYDSIKRLLDPLVIVEAINNVYTDLQLDERYPEYLDVTRDEELARQFLWIHESSKSEE